MRSEEELLPLTDLRLPGLLLSISAIREFSVPRLYLQLIIMNLPNLKVRLIMYITIALPLKNPETILFSCVRSLKVVPTEATVYR